METEEKVRLTMVSFLSILVFQAGLNKFTYTTGLADSLKDLIPWIDMVILVLLGLVLILIALDFIVAGVVPDAIINLLTWIYVLILGVVILLMAVLNQLEL